MKFHRIPWFHGTPSFKIILRGSDTIFVNVFAGAQGLPAPAFAGGSGGSSTLLHGVDHGLWSTFLGPWNIYFPNPKFFGVFHTAAPRPHPHRDRQPGPNGRTLCSRSRELSLADFRMNRGLSQKKVWGKPILGPDPKRSRERARDGRAIGRAGGPAVGRSDSRTGGPSGGRVPMVGQMGGRAVGRSGVHSGGQAIRRSCGGLTANPRDSRAGGRAFGRSAGGRAVGQSDGRAFELSGGRVVGQSGGRAVGPSGGRACTRAVGRAGTRAVLRR